MVLGLSLSTTIRATATTSADRRCYMPRPVKKAMNQFDDEVAQYEPFDLHDPGDAPLDSEIDFDDETDDDQTPLDEVEAIEVGVNLDNPEQADDE
jgi:hypothetical protein